MHLKQLVVNDQVRAGGDTQAELNLLFFLDFPRAPRG